MHRPASGSSTAAGAALGGFVLAAMVGLAPATALAQVAVEQIAPRSGAVHVEQLAPSLSRVAVPQVPAAARLRATPQAPARSARDLLIVGQPIEPAISTRPVAPTPAAFQPPRLPTTYSGVRATVAPSTTTPRLPSTGPGLQGAVER